MKILAMDTALEACSVALMEDETTLAFHHELRKRGHAEMLIPIVKDLMTQKSISFTDLDLIAVTVGPGTFTGLRIGLAAARGFSLAAGIPCVGVTTLETLAAQTAKEISDPLDIIPVIDARRQEIYLQRFRPSQNKSIQINAISEPTACPIDAIAPLLNAGPAVLVGSGLPLLTDRNLIDPSLHQIIDEEANPDARVVALLARTRAENADPLSPPNPLYLRAPDAKLPGGKDPE